MEAEVLPVEAHATQRNSPLVRGRGSERHARVFERCGRVHALVLGVEILDTSRAGASRQMVERRVAFTQRDDMLFGNVRKKFAKAPDSALIERSASRCGA